MIILGKKDKLIKKLKSNQKNFNYDEAETLLQSIGLKKDNKGRTSGSRVSFVGDGFDIKLHKPHPRKELKPYQIEDIIKILEREGLI